MSAHRHQATWRSLIFNRRYLDDGSAGVDNPANLVTAYVNSDFYLDSLDISRVSVQDYREMRQFLEGAEPNEAYEGVRALNGIGRIVAANAADLEDKTWLMNEQLSVAACRMAAVSADPKGVLPFSFKRDTAPATGVELVPATKALRFYARPGPGRPVVIGRTREGLVRPFSFQLIAFDPFAYDEALTQTAWASNPLTVTNPGNVYTRPRIRFNMSGAGVVNFTLTHSTTGKALQLDLTGLGASDDFTIDVARGSIRRDSDNADFYSRRVSGFISDLWLVPGANSITISDAAGIGQLRYDFRGAYA